MPTVVHNEQNLLTGLSRALVSPRLLTAAIHPTELTALVVLFLPNVPPELLVEALMASATRAAIFLGLLPVSSPEGSPAILGPVLT